MTEDEYFAAKPLEERCRYYELETLAATLGKEIHPGGAFAEARSLLQDKTRNPHEVCGTGRDTLVYTYRPTVDSGLVEDVYFQLQKLYREAQARLNSLKHECQSAVNESAVRVKTEFALAVNEWTNERKLVEARHAEWVQRRTNEISAMKIRIPQSLRGFSRRCRVSERRKNKKALRGCPVCGIRTLACLRRIFSGVRLRAARASDSVGSGAAGSGALKKRRGNGQVD